MAHVSTNSFLEVTSNRLSLNVRQSVSGDNSLSLARFSEILDSQMGERPPSTRDLRQPPGRPLEKSETADRMRNKLADQAERRSLDARRADHEDARDRAREIADAEREDQRQVRAAREAESRETESRERSTPVSTSGERRETDEQGTPARQAVARPEKDSNKDSGNTVVDRAGKEDKQQNRMELEGEVPVTAVLDAATMPELGTVSDPEPGSDVSTAIVLPESDDANGTLIPPSSVSSITEVGVESDMESPEELTLAQEPTFSVNVGAGPQDAVTPQEELSGLPPYMVSDLPTGMSDGATPGDGKVELVPGGEDTEAVGITPDKVAATMVDAGESARETVGVDQPSAALSGLYSDRVVSADARPVTGEKPFHGSPGQITQNTVPAGAANGMVAGGEFAATASTDGDQSGKSGDGNNRPMSPMMTILPGQDATRSKGPLRESGFEQLLATADSKGAQQPAQLASDQRLSLTTARDLTPHKPYTTTLPTPMNQEEWSEEFVEKVKWLTSKSIRAAEIHIKPAELGPIDIKIHVHNDQASIVFHSQHAQVRDLLELNVQRLRDMLDGSGINLADVNVSDQSRDNAAQSGGAFGESSSQGGEGAGDDELSGSEEMVSTEANVASSALVDTFV